MYATGLMLRFFRSSDSKIKPLLTPAFDALLRHCPFITTPHFCHELVWSRPRYLTTHTSVAGVFEQGLVCRAALSVRLQQIICHMTTPVSEALQRTPLCFSPSQKQPVSATTLLTGWNWSGKRKKNSSFYFSKLVRCQPRWPFGLIQYTYFLHFSILFLEKLVFSFMASFIIAQGILNTEGKNATKLWKGAVRACPGWKFHSWLGWWLLGRSRSTAADAPIALSKVLTWGKRYQFPFAIWKVPADLDSKLYAWIVGLFCPYVLGKYFTSAEPIPKHSLILVGILLRNLI